MAFLGPVFWPYAYSDIFEYTFWPYAYEPGYWAYAYDDFVDTVFWGRESPYSAYANYPEPGGAITGGGYRTRERQSASPQTVRQLCGNPDKGVTAWHVAKPDTKWFAPSDAPFMINYRVDDLGELLANLRAAGVEVLKGPESHENGKFAWIVDPDGNKVELWEPKLWDEKNKAG